LRLFSLPSFVDSVCTRIPLLQRKSGSRKGDGDGGAINDDNDDRKAVRVGTAAKRPRKKGADDVRTVDQRM
jgi:hypothetical protein